MPREQINYPKYQPVLETDAHGYPKCEPIPTHLLHVAWNKQGEWVQVGLQCDKARLLKFLDQYTPDDDGTVLLWTEPIDRTACNKLVRIARRARDQAYGADE